MCIFFSPSAQLPFHFDYYCPARPRGVIIHPFVIAVGVFGRSATAAGPVSSLFLAIRAAQAISASCLRGSAAPHRRYRNFARDAPPLRTIHRYTILRPNKLANEMPSGAKIRFPAPRIEYLVARRNSCHEMKVQY